MASFVVAESPSNALNPAGQQTYGKAGTSADAVPGSSAARDAVERSLWWWNLSCGILHLVQAIACLIISFSSARTKAFKLPLTTVFLSWKDGYPQQELQVQGFLPFGATVSGFAWMSAAAHFTVLLFWTKYTTDLRRGINRFRWVEYACSSSLMIALISMLFGVYDILSLVLIMSINACMNFFGDLHEIQNAERREAGIKTTTWLAFFYGCFAGAVPWAVIFAYLGGSPSASGIPGFVFGVLIAYIIFFNTFPINMILQYLKVSWWGDHSWPGLENGGYYFGERVYQILSLASKSLLLWIVIGGTNQPNSYSK